MVVLLKETLSEPTLNFPYGAHAQLLLTAARRGFRYPDRAAGVRFGCALGMETHYPELFSAYEEQDVDCVLFSTHGNAESPGIFAVEAAGHAAANSLWVSYAGPAGGPPAGLVDPDGTWAARCTADGAGLAVAEVSSSTGSPARVWRRTARSSLRD